MSDLWIWAIVIVAIVLFIYIKKHFKHLRIGSLTLFSGGVKTGKTTLAVYTAVREYKRTLRSVKISNFFRRVFRKKEYELPLLYSNIPLSVSYVPITHDLLLRKKRFRELSVILVDEASLVADSMLFKDKDINERLLLFNKLIGHECGGKLIYSSQAVGDLHFSIKRCLGSYFYVNHISTWLPFFIVAEVLEQRYAEDGSIISVDTKDLDDNVKRVVIPKSTWKKFDSRCFSYLTDDLPCEDNVVNATSLKATDLVSFRDYQTIKTITEVKNNEKT